MSEESGSYNAELFKMDLEVFVSAIKNKDFKTATIISNRIMTNAWISDTQYYGIAGFFLRVSAIRFLNMNNSNISDIIVAEISKFTDNVLEQISSNKKDLKKLWIDFGIVLEKTRKEILPDDEKNYNLNTKYTTKTIDRILKLLFNSTNTLTHSSNNFIRGILQEIERTTQTYGINSNGLYLFSLLTMIDRIDEYIKIEMNTNEFKIRINNEILPLIKKLQEIYENNIEEKQINNLLWDLIKKWRIYYIQFMEPIIQLNQTQPLIIEEKIKDELVKELAEGIEKEVINE